MKRTVFLVLVTLSLPLLAGENAGTEPLKPAGGSDGAVEARFGMHPPVPVRDATGAVPSRLSSIDTGRSCGSCHDVGWISAHNDHFSGSRKVGCMACHTRGALPDSTAGLLDAEGRVPADKLAIQAPSNGNCGHCHGLVHEGPLPLELPADFDTVERSDRYSMSRLTGTIFSPHRVSESFMNIPDKSAQTRYWDVHAATGVGCTSCHYVSNNPGKADRTVRRELLHLKRDPRALSTAEYLRRPDHRLETARCQTCHDPLAVHGDLPFRERHMEVLACQSCHVPTVPGPAASTIDLTMLDSQRSPQVAYRGIDEGEGTPTVRLTRGYQPFLFPALDGDQVRLSPFNLVTYWYWVDAAGIEVGRETLEAALMDRSGKFRPEVLAVFDRNGDGQIVGSELRMDTPEKREALTAALASQGVADPTVAGRVAVQPVSHGVVGKGFATHDCSACHSPNGRLDGTIPLAAWVPYGAPTSPEMADTAEISGAIVQTEAGGLVLERTGVSGSVYVPGRSHQLWSDTVGFTLLGMTLVALGAHAAFRILSSRRRMRAVNGLHEGSGEMPEPLLGEPVLMYSLYERIWHWTMAASVLALLLTGLGIHYPKVFPMLQFPRSVSVHSVAAAILVINAFLALFYHLATSEIRQFIPQRTRFLPRLAEMAKYYARGIFEGASRPFRKTRDGKLNPLQQVTYVALLNVLFPAQIVTGTWLWVAGWKPEWVGASWAFGWVASVHNLGSWLFLSFLLAHVYLTTTGHTLSAHIRAMVTGYEAEELEGKGQQVRLSAGASS